MNWRQINTSREIRQWAMLLCKPIGFVLSLGTSLYFTSPEFRMKIEAFFKKFKKPR